MSLSMEECKNALDILARAKNNPKLIFTDLFIKELDGLNFLYQVKINNTYLYDYLKECIKNIKEFENCIVSFDKYFMKISIGNFEMNTCFINIDLSKKNFSFINVEKDKLMSKLENGVSFPKYLMITKEDNENETILSNNNVLKKIKRFYKKHSLLNIFFLYKKRKKIEKAKEKINKINEERKELYEKELLIFEKEKDLYSKKIIEIEEKQQQFKEYLEKFNYIMLEK